MMSARLVRIPVLGSSSSSCSSSSSSSSSGQRIGQQSLIYFVAPLSLLERGQLIRFHFSSQFQLGGGPNCTRSEAKKGLAHLRVPVGQLTAPDVRSRWRPLARLWPSGAATTSRPAHLSKVLAAAKAPPMRGGAGRFRFGRANCCTWSATWTRSNCHQSGVASQFIIRVAA